VIIILRTSWPRRPARRARCQHHQLIWADLRESVATAAATLPWSSPGPNKNAPRPPQAAQGRRRPSSVVPAGRTASLPVAELPKRQPQRAAASFSSLPIRQRAVYHLRLDLRQVLLEREARRSGPPAKSAWASGPRSHGRQPSTVTRRRGRRRRRAPIVPSSRTLPGTSTPESLRFASAESEGPAGCARRRIGEERDRPGSTSSRRFPQRRNAESPPR